MSIIIKDLTTIEGHDREYHILKRTSVLLMPRWQKFKCQDLEDLIRALKIEKVWIRFQEDMEAVRMAEKGLNEHYTKESFLEYVLLLAVRDFKNGNFREELVAKWLTSKGWDIEPYSDSRAYSLEGKGIDIVATRMNPKTHVFQTRNIQVKSAGFMYSPDKYVKKQLRKMVLHGTFLFVVNQHKKNKISYYDPEVIRDWYKMLGGSDE